MSIIKAFYEKIRNVFTVQPGNAKDVSGDKADDRAVRANNSRRIAEPDDSDFSSQPYDCRGSSLVSPKKRIQLRSRPVSISAKEGENFFQLDYCKQPRDLIWNDYADNGDGTVTDHATGLMWEQSGSQMYLKYEQAEEYIRELNSRKFAGYSDWRMPTVEELYSLMEERRHSNGLYIDAIFDKTQRWCWSADKCLPDGAWNVSFLDGQIYWDLLAFDTSVRGVRSLFKDSE